MSCNCADAGKAWYLVRNMKQFRMKASRAINPDASDSSDFIAELTYLEAGRLDETSEDSVYEIVLSDHFPEIEDGSFILCVGGP